MKKVRNRLWTPTMGRLIARYVIMVFVLSAGLWYAAKLDADRYRPHLGEKVILQGEELEVIDYSVYRSVLILEDGREVSLEYVERKFK